MSFPAQALHLVCGDNAVAGVRQVLGEAAQIRVLRDDLAVGPLLDVDAPPCARRQAFWTEVWPDASLPPPDVVGLADDAVWLAGLDQLARPLVVWHGDSCSEQLLLARVAAAVEDGPTPLWGVACGNASSRVGQRMAVAMHAPEDLAKRANPLPLSGAQVAALARQWREAVAENACVRRWQGDGFHGEDFSTIDAALLDACARYPRLARAMAEVMAHCDGFFATDLFLYWRARVLAGSGQLQLVGEPAEEGYAGIEVVAE